MANSNILIGADAGRFECFGRQLFVLVGDHMDAGWEVIDVGSLPTKVEDANFGVGDTAVEARLRVRLDISD